MTCKGTVELEVVGGGEIENQNIGVLGMGGRFKGLEGFGVYGIGLRAEVWGVQGLGLRIFCVLRSGVM